MPIRHKFLDKGLVVNLHGNDTALSDQDRDLLKEANFFRFDPSNNCNASCVFCESAFNSRAARLSLEVYQEALQLVAKSPNLGSMQIGCTYEPTIRKDLVEFGRLLESTSFVSFPEVIAFVSNCWLLHKHDLAPFVRGGLNKLHVSVHSQTPEEFKAVMGKDHSQQLAENLRSFKSQFPHVVISAVNVVNRLNMADPAEFVRWAFDDVGVDYLRFSRAQIYGTVDDSPAKAALEESELDTFALSDDEWKVFGQKVMDVDSETIEVVESTQKLKFGSLNIDALRIKRRDALSEMNALRQARKYHLENYATAAVSSS